MNDFRRQWADVGGDVMRAVAAAGESGWYILGEQVRSFERNLAAYWGTRHAIGVASGLDAIEIALKASGLRAGDKVLTTPMSAFATTMAIVRQGGIPVYCDTDERGLIDLDEAREALRAFPEIRFFVPVHLYGFAIDPGKLTTFIEEFSLTCIEDCAQSIGATALTGRAAATSFYPTKNLGAMGDGGAVLTNDEDLAKKIRLLRDYGQSAKYVHAEMGWNSRLDEVHAAILDQALLPRLDRWTARRREIAARYLAGWRHDAVKPMGAKSGDACWHLFPVLTEHKASLLAHLRKHRVGFGEHYPRVIPDQPAMREAFFATFGDIPRARCIAAGEVSLPIHSYLSDDEADRVLAVIGEWRPEP